MDSSVGIEIGGTKLQLVLGDSNGTIRKRERFEVRSTGGAEGIREQIQQSLPSLIGNEKIRGIGVGFGGPVDWQSGRICRSHQIEGWSEFDLAGWLEKLTGARVAVDNDANVAALGEARSGAGTGSNPVFYATLGSGVGGGLVLAGKIYHGDRPGEAELGHIRLDRSGTIVESCCSGWAVDAQIREASRKSLNSFLTRRLQEEPGGEAKHLRAAVERQDPDAIRILEDLTINLAFALSHVVHLFHPQIIVLGGGLSKIGEPLRAGVEKQIPNFVMDAFAPGPRIVLSKLGEDAVPAGAIHLAADAFPAK